MYSLLVFSVSTRADCCCIRCVSLMKFLQFLLVPTLPSSLASHVDCSFIFVGSGFKGATPSHIWIAFPSSFPFLVSFPGFVPTVARRLRLLSDSLCRRFLVFFPCIAFFPALSPSFPSFSSNVYSRGTGQRWFSSFAFVSFARLSSSLNCYFRCPLLQRAVKIRSTEELSPYNCPVEEKETIRLLFLQ